MLNGIVIFTTVWLLTQVACLLMLRAGSQLANHRYLLCLGKLAHQQKIRSLDRIWPLTRIRPALADGDLNTCVVILAALIVLKSLACLIVGMVMVFWLPLASMLVPSLVAVHNPDDPGLRRWVQKVAALQVTSHILAAALGFTLFWLGPWSGTPLIEVVESNVVLIMVASLSSIGLAIAAGYAEALGLMQQGI